MQPLIFGTGTTQRRRGRGHFLVPIPWPGAHRVSRRHRHHPSKQNTSEDKNGFPLRLCVENTLAEGRLLAETLFGRGQVLIGRAEFRPLLMAVDG
jgi:hypothetical protein